MRATPTKLFYITWSTHYRFRVVATTCVRDDLGSCIFDAAHRHGIDAVAVNVQPHHAHALVWIPARMSAAKAVGLLKGASHHFLARHPVFPADLPIWAGGYHTREVPADEMDAVTRDVIWQDEREAIFWN